MVTVSKKIKTVGLMREEQIHLIKFKSKILKIKSKDIKENK